MKTSKRYLPLVLLFLMATVTSTHAQTGVSVKAGAHYSNLILKDASGDRRNTQFTPGWHVGLSVDLPVSSTFYIQPGLRYSRKGFTQDDSWFAGAGNNLKVSVSYIELPLNVLYKHSLASGRLFVGAGPYLAYGTGGEWESDERIQIGDVIHDDYGRVHFIKNSDERAQLQYAYGKPWDYGANITAGYEFLDRVTVQFNVQIGLADLEPDDDDSQADRTRQNIGFGISLGYEL